MYTGVMVLLTINTSEHERPVYFGMTGLIWGAGTILGPVIGGAFADYSPTWRWSFYINLCIGGACAPIYLLLLPGNDPCSGTRFKDRLRCIDFIGTIIMCGSFTTGIMAISFGGTLFNWDSGTIIGLFVASGILAILFFLDQRFSIGRDRHIESFLCASFGHP